ncbi:hypothetical protein TTHERM_00189200 (macronuclear) [Tetrahymena thermophila SB210]|uniref:Uncharacterized protein n=1 Tax=Tetrahymena thermophila (strain SB210) TaxID=312017 RepID=I7M801_TETTS|nr:hypothetical protein TTHERM_00189200 [Tetrahymena thermophila SB210]EAR96351.2 hypothetical protein TTHERM_00189200 [Tetrahymena thermophila SB210]|eukprot:XP_001016596.2 hypothetical protein TTHERM_00189200 [Tetrahymena thermophila SB210]
MSLRKPKHDNFSKLGFKIDRLNQTRNQKNIQTIINCINKQEQDYKLTDFDIFLYHIYSKPISSCLKQPEQSVDKNSPLSLQEQNIVYEQMNQYLAHLKELRQEFQNDNNHSFRTRIRRFSEVSDDINSDTNSVNQIQNFQKKFKQQLDSKLQNFVYESNKSLSHSQKFKNNFSLEHKDDFSSKKSYLDKNSTQKIVKNRSKTQQEEAQYSDDQSEMSSYRQGFSKNQGLDSLRFKKNQQNQKQMNFFYGTKTDLQKASKEEKALMEDIEQLKNKNQNKLIQIEQQNEQKQIYSPSPIMINKGKQYNKIIENMNNLQYYNKIIPQNASLTRSNITTNQILRDAIKKQNLRLKRQVFQKVPQTNTSKSAQFDNDKANKKCESVENGYQKSVNQDSNSLNQSSIDANMQSPSNKYTIKEKASQILSDFNVKLLQMDYQLKKSRAFINQEEDSDLEDTQTFQKRLKMEQDKIDSMQKEKYAKYLSEQHMHNSDDEEQGGLSPQNGNKSKLEMMKIQKQNINSALFDARQQKCRSQSPLKNEIFKIFNQSLSNSISGSQIMLLNQKANNQKQSNQQINISEVNNPNKNNNSFCIQSPNNNRNSSFLINQESQNNQNQEQITDNNQIFAQTPKQIKNIQESPKQIFLKKINIQQSSNTPQNQYNHKNSFILSNLPNTFKSIKSNQIPTPLIKNDIQHPTKTGDNYTMMNKEIKFTQVLGFDQNRSGTPYSQSKPTNCGKYFQLNLYDSPIKKKISTQHNLFDQNGNKIQHEALNFSSQYEMIKPLAFSEKKVRSTSLSPALKFNSQQKNNNNQFNIQVNENFPRLNSIQSEEKLNQSIFSESIEKNSSTPQNQKKYDEKQVKVLEDKKKALPKINMVKYKNETSLLNKMEDMHAQSKQIKKQFLKISKQFQEQFSSKKTDIDENENSTQLQTDQQEQLQSQVKINNSRNNKNKNNLSIAKDSINLNFYLEIQEQIIQEKKKRSYESQVKNIQAYHLYHLYENCKTPHI